MTRLGWRTWVAVGMLSLVVACAPGPPGGVGPVGASSIQAVPSLISFPGTTTGSIVVTADGTWTASSEQAWVRVSPASGSGSATVTVTVDRTGLSPGHYAASILFKGAAAREVATVYMRFPNVSGSISGPPGRVLSAETGGVVAGAGAEGDFEYVPGEVLVLLDPAAVALDLGSLEAGPIGELTPAGVDPLAMTQAARNLASAYRLSVQAPISAELGAFVLETGGREVMSVVRELRRDGRVRGVSPNYVARALRTPNDPQYSAQWHYGSISLPAAWNLTTGATDRVVAIVDSGIDPAHVDLAARIVPGYDFVLNTTVMSDPDGHGTHVAGTVGAATNNAVGVAGVDWNTRLMPVRVLDHLGSGTWGDISRGTLFAAGFCVSNSEGALVCPDPQVRQAQVINLSIGVHNPTCAAMPSIPAMEHAVTWAVANGSVVVAAAGNDDCPVVSIPAAYAPVIAVSATGPTNLRAPYSNSGDQIWISAPGGDQSVAFGLTGGVLSTFPGGGYAWFQGTSMASPHVAGVASLMLAANRDLSPAYVKLLLRDTATDLGAIGWDSVFGFGLVHAEGAVARAREFLTARNTDFIVRIRSGVRVIAETRADAGGSYTFENVPAGSYTIEAGTDVNRNGVLGEPGEFFGSAAQIVAYTGDFSGVTLSVTPR